MHQLHNKAVSEYSLDSNRENLMESFKQTVRNLQNLERRLAHAHKLACALNHMKHGVIVLDQNGDIEDINKSAAEMLGVAGENIAGRPVTELLRAPGLDKAVALGVEAVNMLAHTAEGSFTADYTRFNTNGGTTLPYAVIVFQPVRYPPVKPPQEKEATGRVKATDEEIGDDAQENIEAVVLAHINKIMRAEGGNISRAARRLGIDRNTLKRRLNP